MASFKFAVVAACAAVIGLATGAFGAPQLSTTTSIKVFDQPNYRGSEMTFDRGVPSLAAFNFNDRTASVQIQGNRDWVLCEHRNYMGKCVRVHVKEKDLKRLKIQGQVSSLYPVPVTASRN